MNSSSNSLAGYILSQARDSRLHEHPIERRLNRPFVTISRQAGAYGHTFADSLSEYLKKHERRENAPWAVFDKNLVKTIIEENQYPEDVEPLLSEVPLPEITDTLEELFGVHPSQNSMMHRMSKLILELAQTGYAVLVGRGANIITRRLGGGIHVRLIGSLEKRLTHYAEYFRIPEKKARKLLLKEQQDRRRFIKKYFDEDIENPLLYHFTINTDDVRIDEAVEMIGNVVLKGGRIPVVPAEGKS